MRKSAVLGWVLAVSLCGGLLFAAPPLPQDPSREDYTVGPRDILKISVWGEDLSVSAEVSAQGNITFFFLGEVQVNGLTVAQIREKIIRLLADGYIRIPVVNVGIEEYRSKEVQIQGAINKPGTYILETNYTTLLKLISMAGGAAPNRGFSAFIFRGGSVALQAAQGPEPTPSPSAGPSHPSPPAENQNIHLRTSEPIPLPPVLEGNEKIEIDLRLLIDQGDASRDVIVYPGDYVFIGSKTSESTSVNYVWIEGAVRTPKPLEWQPGLTVLQAIIQCGGFSDVSSPNRTTITRIGPEGTQTIIRVRLKDIQRGKKPDVLLQPGDRITVPESVF